VSHERFSRRKWDRSWRYRRSGDCTTATKDGPPKKLEIGLRIVLGCTRVSARISFTRLEQVHELLEPRGLVRGMTSLMDRTEYSVAGQSLWIASF
jgi:hypothetical protein